MVMSPVGLETKNHCADDGQQRFNSQAVRQYEVQNLCDLYVHQDREVHGLIWGTVREFPWSD
jgi:hypothetical protein